MYQNEGYKQGNSDEFSYGDNGTVYDNEKNTAKKQRMAQNGGYAGSNYYNQNSGYNMNNNNSWSNNGGGQFSANNGNGYGQNYGYGNYNNSQNPGQNYSQYADNNNYYGSNNGNGNYNNYYASQNSWVNGYNGMQKSDEKSARALSIVAAICFILSCTFSVIYLIDLSLQVNIFSESSIIVNNVLPTVLTIVIAVLLFIGKKNVGLIIVYGIYTALTILSFSISPYFQLLTMDFVFIKILLVSAISLIAVILFMVTVILGVISKKGRVNGFTKNMWFIAAVVHSIGLILRIVLLGITLYFDNIVYLVSEVFLITAYLLAGLWLKKSNE